MKRVTLVELWNTPRPSPVPLWVDQPLLDIPNTMLAAITSAASQGDIGALSFRVTGTESDAAVRDACAAKGLHAVWVAGPGHIRLNPPPTATREPAE